MIIPNNYAITDEGKKIWICFGNVGVKTNDKAREHGCRFQCHVKLGVIESIQEFTSYGWFYRDSIKCLDKVIAVGQWAHEMITIK